MPSSSQQLLESAKPMAVRALCGVVCLWDLPVVFWLGCVCEGGGGVCCDSTRAYDACSLPCPASYRLWHRMVIEGVYISMNPASVDRDAIHIPNHA